METKKLIDEINGLSDKLARITENFGRTFNMSLAPELTETRRLLREKKEQLEQNKTINN